MSLVEDQNARAEGLRVLAHPLRLRLLSLLTAKALSGSEAARELGESQANVSYHLRRLHRAGLVSEVKDPEQRGRTRRFRHEVTSGEQLASNQVEDEQLLAASLAAELQRRAHDYLPGSPQAFTDAEFWVAAQTWTRALAAARQVGIDLHRGAVAERSRNAVRVSATISLFQMSSPEEATGPSAGEA